MRHAAALILPLALLVVACDQQRVRIPPPPEVVRVPVERIVEVPPALTRRMAPDAPREQTAAEAKRLALVRLQIILAGNCRLLRIVALGRPLTDDERAEWAANDCEGRAP